VGYSSENFDGFSFCSHWFIQNISLIQMNKQENNKVWQFKNVVQQWDVGPSVYKECSFPLIFINTRQTRFQMHVGNEGAFAITRRRKSRETNSNWTIYQDVTRYLSRDPQYQKAVLLCRPILLATVAHRGKPPKIPMLIHIIVKHKIIKDKIIQLSFK